MTPYPSQSVSRFFRTQSLKGLVLGMFESLFGIINTPLGEILKFIANLVGGSFAASVFIFTLIINIALVPLTIKSQKSSVQQLRIKPKLDDIKKRYADDKQRQSEETQKLYQEEKVSMAGGCGPMIFRLLLMMSIYYLILSPLTYMTGVEKAKIEKVSSAITSGMERLEKKDEAKYKEYKELLDWDNNSTRANQLSVVRVIRKDIDIREILTDEQYKKVKSDFKYIKEMDTKAGIDYTLFTDKLDLTEKPHFSLDIFDAWETIWLIPIGAYLAQFLTSLLSMYQQKKQNPDAPNMAFMMLTMPLISLFIGFTLPAGVGFYWICSSLIGGGIQFVMQQFYGPQKLLAKERSKELKERSLTELKQISIAENSAE